MDSIWFFLLPVLPYGKFHDFSFKFSHGVGSHWVTKKLTNHVRIPVPSMWSFPVAILRSSSTTDSNDSHPEVQAAHWLSMGSILFCSSTWLYTYPIHIATVFVMWRIMAIFFTVSGASRSTGAKDDITGFATFGDIPMVIPVAIIPNPLALTRILHDRNASFTSKCC